MKILDEAKTMLEELFKVNDCNCLTAKLQSSCCGSSLMFNLSTLEKDDSPISINGIDVLMDEETTKRAETVTLSVKDGQLSVKDEAASSCCC
ncbi:MAG: hypothetical protein M0P10_11830 [Sphaerochaetaceae bacterium]|jgi:hypothetical protein|nr:hypothetical protein [Sphaerochaetaceae bacterium]